MTARGSQRRRASGFTLVEMLITVAIAGVLAGMSAMALNRLKSRGNFASATGDFLATLRTARAEAYARGNPTVVTVDVDTGRWWSVEDINGDFSLAAFDPATPAPSAIASSTPASSPAARASGRWTGGSGARAALFGDSNRVRERPARGRWLGRRRRYQRRWRQHRAQLQVLQLLRYQLEAGRDHVPSFRRRHLSAGGRSAFGQQISLQDIMQAQSGDGGVSGSRAESSISPSWPRPAPRRR